MLFKNLPGLVERLPGGRYAQYYKVEDEPSQKNKYEPQTPVSG
jgi:hypothetical protein